MVVVVFCGANWISGRHQYDRVAVSDGRYGKSSRSRDKKKIKNIGGREFLIKFQMCVR